MDPSSEILLPGIDPRSLESTAPIRLGARVKVINPGIYSDKIVGCVGTVSYLRIGGYGIDMDDTPFGPRTMWLSLENIELHTA